MTGVSESELVVKDGLSRCDGLAVSERRRRNRGDEKASRGLRGDDGGRAGGEGERKRSGREEVEREWREGVMDGEQVLRVEVKGETLRVKKEVDMHVNLHGELLLEDVALTAVVVVLLHLIHHLHYHLGTLHA